MTITAIILTAIVLLAVLALVAFIGYAVGYREGAGDYYQIRKWTKDKSNPSSPKRRR